MSQANKLLNEAAAELLNKAAASSKTTNSWFDLLKEADRKFIREVAREMSMRPDVNLSTASALLIAEFDIKRTRETVSRKLRELISNV